MDKQNPTGTGSFSLNRLQNQKIGDYSFVEGYESYATGDYAHAEGFNTAAFGQASHSEGQGSISNGDSSHAEGRESYAIGFYSHAEGNLTRAEGVGSHTEGDETVAKGRSQHVFGEYNVSDTNIDTKGKGKYVEIVGNGSSDTARSNARTLDWDGNETIAGNLQASGLTDGTTTKTMSEILAGGGFKITMRWY